MALSIAATRAGREDAESGPVVDACVFHTWQSDVEVFEYLQPAWREYVLSHVPDTWRRLVACDGSKPGTSMGGPLSTLVPYRRGSAGTGAGFVSATELVEQHLGPGNVEHVVLCARAATEIPTIANPRLSIEVSRALNEWTCERWLGVSQQLIGTVVVPTQVPEEGAAEIRRCAGRPGLGAVLLAGNGLGKPFGHPVYDPILRAASECELPVIIVSGGDAMVEAPAYPTGGGIPGTQAEFQALAPHALMTHTASLICQGVTERYPNLSFLLLGGGGTWLMPFLWRLDSNARAFRHDIAWLERAPSDVFWDHFKVGTGPFPSGADGDALARYLRVEPRLADAMCYASGFPDQLARSPADTAQLLPEEWRDAVFRGNTSAFLHLDSVGDTATEVSLSSDVVTRRGA